MKAKVKLEDDSVPVEVEMTVVLPRWAAIWYCERALDHGDEPQNMAASVLIDVAREDRLAHDEPIEDGTLH